MKYYGKRGIREDYSHLNRRNTVGSPDASPASSPNSMGY
jgi:hypothetical protein